MQPRSRKPLTNLSPNIQHNKRNPHANRPKKSKSFISTINDAIETGSLSTPFKNTLNISSIPNKQILCKPSQKMNTNSDEDDDLQKPLHFISKSCSNSNNNSIPTTPNKYNKYSNISNSNSNSLTITPTQSMSPSPGVIKNKQNIPSPQRIPIISLRSFHTINHVEFYKPIPISQSRSTQFEIINETYDNKSVKIIKKNINKNYISCITIAPTAIEIKRYEKCIITVTCTPINIMRIKEIISIQWDLHSIQVYIHAIGFNKNIKSNIGNKQRGYRKRTLINMRKEDNDKCNSVQSSLQNSAQLQKKRRNRRAMLSPTIRRERAFTAAPFASPAPNKIRNNFIFNNNNKQQFDELSTVKEDLNDTNVTFTPKHFKKRRVINESQKKRGKFEKLCIAVTPIQALFRCYLAQKRCKQLIKNNKKKQRQEYYFGIIKSQLMTIRVRKMYLNYKNASIILQSVIKTYCIKKKYNEYINELLRKEREEQIRLKKERDKLLSKFIMSFVYSKRVRNQYLNIKHSTIVLQSVFKTYYSKKYYIQKWNKMILIQSYIKGKLQRNKYLQIQKEQQKKQCVLGIISLWRLYKFKDIINRKKRYILMRNNAANYIQLWFNGTIYRKKYIEYMYQKQLNDTTIFIQSWFKGNICRNKYISYMKYQQKKQCVLGILSLYRLQKFRNIINEKKRYICMTNNAANYIQIWFKGVMYRRQYIQYVNQQIENKNNAIMYIQIWFNGVMYRRKYVRYMNQKIQYNAAVYIQSWFKGILYMKYQQKKQCVLGVLALWRLQKFRDVVIEKKRYIVIRKNNATMYVQIWFKGVMCRRNYIKYLYKEKVRNNRVMYIQLWFRGILYRKRYVEYIVQRMRNNAAVYIQSWFKGKMCRRNCIYMINKKRRYIRITNNAAKYIQIWFKGVIYRRQYIEYLYRKKIKNSATMYIQLWFRGVMYRRNYIEYLYKEQQNNAAECIQIWFRGIMYRNKYIQYIRYEKKKKCVLGLVVLWRQNKLRKYILMRHNATMYIQLWFKGIMYRRKYLDYRIQQQVGYVQKIIKIQGLVRGKLLRMEQYNNRNGLELQQIINNVNRAHCNWKKENSVNYLLNKALSQLTKSRTLYGVSEACDTLENLLKIVPNISNRIAEHNIIGSLFHVLRNSNRSVPHLNLVTKILNFFLFFGQHDYKCYKAIFYRNDTLDILSERLQIHRLDFVLFELTTNLFLIGVDVDVPDHKNKFLINLRKSDINKQIRTLDKIMSSKLIIAKRVVNNPSRKVSNANIQHEKTLKKCVENMKKLVDRL